MQMNPQQTMIQSMKDQYAFESSIAAVRKVQEQQRSGSSHSLLWMAVSVWLLILFVRRRGRASAKAPGA